MFPKLFLSRNPSQEAQSPRNPSRNPKSPMSDFTSIRACYSQIGRRYCMPAIGGPGLSHQNEDSGVSEAILIDQQPCWRSCFLQEAYFYLESACDSHLHIFKAQLSLRSICLGRHNRSGWRFSGTGALELSLRWRRSRDFSIRVEVSCRSQRPNDFCICSSSPRRSRTRIRIGTY